MCQTQNHGACVASSTLFKFVWGLCYKWNHPPDCHEMQWSEIIQTRGNSSYLLDGKPHQLLTWAYSITSQCRFLERRIKRTPYVQMQSIDPPRWATQHLLQKSLRGYCHACTSGHVNQMLLWQGADCMTWFKHVLLLLIYLRRLVPKTRCILIVKWIDNQAKKDQKSSLLIMYRDRTRNECGINQTLCVR